MELIHGKWPNPEMWNMVTLQLVSACELNTPKMLNSRNYRKWVNDPNSQQHPLAYKPVLQMNSYKV